MAGAKAELAGARAGRIAAEEALTTTEGARRRLERMIVSLRHAVWDACSEKSDPDQAALPFEDIEVTEGMLAAAQEKADAAVGKARPELRARPTARARSTAKSC